MEALHDAIARLEAANRSYVQVTVVRRIRPSSANVGDRAVVTAEGEMTGFVGGQCTRSLVVEQARLCLESGESRLLLVTAHPPADPGEGVLVLPMTCHSEGTVELFLEPRLQRPLLAVVGASPIAEALCRLAPTVGFEAVQATLELSADAGGVNAHTGESPADSCEVPATHSAQTSHGERHAAAIDPALRLRQSFAGYENRQTYGVVATVGLYDVDGVIALMDRPLYYFGVVTSPRRWHVLKQDLHAQGVPTSLCDFARAPAGLDIGATGPDEIALSILAEVVLRRRRGGETWEPEAGGIATSHVTARRLVAVASSSCEVRARVGVERACRAIDPVCGMTVDLATAKHVTVHDGVTYGFCCEGCKAKFEATPAAYL